MEKHICERKKKIENQPNFNHFHVWCLWEAFNNGDEHAREDQHDSQIDSQSRFEEERLEIVSDVADDIEKNGGQIHGGHDT